MTIPAIADLKFQPKVISDACIYYELRWPAKDRRIGVIKATVFGDTADIGDGIIDDLQAERENRLAALRHASVLRRWKQSLKLKVQRLPKLRGHAVGTFLLENALAELKARGCRRVIARITQGDLDDNPGLLSWYKRFGFARNETRSGCELSLEF